jgi:hypothetical protein
MRSAPLLAVACLFALGSPSIMQGPPPPKPGFADAILGRWDLTVQGPKASYPSWLEISLRRETEIMGRFVGQFGSNRHVTEITYKDGGLVVRIPSQYEDNKSDLIFKGRLTGDRLEGTTSHASAPAAAFKWSAVRAPDLVRDDVVTWGQPVELFDGKELEGWNLRSAERPSCWSVAEDALTNTPPCVDIISDRAFTDFKLHLEFNIVPKSNSGVYLRGRYEVQIQDDVGKAIDSLRMGGVYGFLRPRLNAAGQPGEWQTYDITLIGRRVTVVLNDRTIIDDAEIPGITGGALDSNEGSPGPLMLQGDHGKVSFRKIVLTPAS